MRGHEAAIADLKSMVPVLVLIWPVLALVTLSWISSVLEPEASSVPPASLAMVLVVLRMSVPPSASIRPPFSLHQIGDRADAGDLIAVVVEDVGGEAAPVIRLSAAASVTAPAPVSSSAKTSTVSVPPASIWMPLLVLRLLTTMRG